MKATVFSKSDIIGYTDLIIGNASMGHVYGTFIPNQFYPDHIQKQVWDFWKTTKPDYEKWDALDINVKMEDGYQLEPQGGITVDELEEFPNELKQINIVGLNLEVLNDYFRAT